MNRRNNRRRNNKGIATWLKWLLGIMAVGFVLCLATCGTAAYFTYQAVHDAMDPVKAEKVAGTIATIKKLPANYKYAFGMDMMVMTMVAVQNETNKMTFMLIKLPASQGTKEPKSADEFVEQMATQGVPTAQGSGNGKTTIEVKEKGKTKVGGIEMPYIIGLSENSNTSKKQPAFLGCIMPTKDQAILVCAVTEDETKPIDMKEVNEFLTNIESFK